MSVEPQASAARRVLAPGAPPAFKSAALDFVRHGFFGRQGGVSAGIYASLNAGTGSNDDAAHVAENRRRIAAAFAAEPDHLIGVHQVHSPDAVLVDAPWTGERPHADAVATKTPGLVLSVLTADCAPVLLADEQAGVVAAAHAGWKGALGGVLENTVALMCEHGAAPERIAAAIGPCIHQPSYEVGAEFEARIRDADPAFARFFTPGADGKFQFDLPGFCRAKLDQIGVGTIDTLPLDTYARPAAFHSHRRSVHEKAGDYGRNCAAIALG